MNEQDRALAERHAERERISHALPMGSDKNDSDAILELAKRGVVKLPKHITNDILLHGQLDIEGRVWCAECKVWNFPQNVVCNHLSGTDVVQANPERYSDRIKERKECSEVFVSWWKYPNKEPQIQLTVNTQGCLAYGKDYMVLSLKGAEELVHILDQLIKAHKQVPA